MWAGIGLALSVGMLALAAWRGGHSGTNFYEGAGYEMTERTHRGFAVAGAIFAVLFVGSLAVPGAAIPLLALCTLTLILYLASFARGASGEDE